MDVFKRATRWLAGLTLLGCMSAIAAPITFIHSGIGSGTLAGNAFTSTAFTITATGDTGGVASCGALCNFVDHGSASINISGVGVFNFVTATRTFFVDGAFDRVGFSRAGPVGLDLYNGPNTAALDGWNMQTSIGPVLGTGELLQWSGFGFDDVNTSGGLLVFNNGRDDGSFQAITDNQVPEPGSISLVALTLLACAAVSRRRT